jgi:hypothetical protein
VNESLLSMQCLILPQNETHSVASLLLQVMEPTIAGTFQGRRPCPAFKNPNSEQEA